jgi:hypothetical protein
LTYYSLLCMAEHRAVILSGNYSFSLPAATPTARVDVGELLRYKYRAMHERNFQARSRNHSYRGKAVLHILRAYTAPWGGGYWK